MKNVTAALGRSPARSVVREPISSAAQAVDAIGAVVLCHVCRSPKRHLVDAALANRAIGTAVAKEFKFSKSAVYRHSATCLPARVAKANVDREDRLDAAALIDAMQELQGKTKAQLDLAIASKHKPADVAKLIRETREGVIALGRFIGAFAGENASTIVDNRIQIASLQNLSTADLQALTTALRSKAER